MSITHDQFIELYEDTCGNVLQLSQWPENKINAKLKRNTLDALFQHWTVDADWIMF